MVNIQLISTNQRTGSSHVIEVSVQLRTNDQEDSLVLVCKVSLDTGEL